MITVPPKPAAILSVSMAMLGLLNVACGGPGESAPDNSAPSSESSDAHHSAISTVVPTSPIPERYRCHNDVIVSNPDECPTPASAVIIESGQPESSPPTDLYGDNFDPKVSCFEQNSIADEVVSQHARAMLPSLVELLEMQAVELSRRQSQVLAIAFGVCEVRVDEARTLLAEGALGRQYRELLPPCRLVLIRISDRFTRASRASLW